MWARTNFSALISSLVVVLISTAHSKSDWSPRLAAQYLDARQKAWFAWPPAMSPDGPCVSCHTGMPYLLARPALRRLLNEKQPTQYETGLLDRLRAHAGDARPAGPLQGVETIFAALFLTQPSAGASSSAARQAFEQLWTLQVQQGGLKGGWPWYSANLDPWETPPSFLYGTALAVLAIGAAPAEYRAGPDAQDHIRAMGEYLKRGLDDRPLHSRLALLWASTRWREAMTPPARRAMIDEVIHKQEPDGGWALESLGPWAAHPDAPVSSGSNSYATAFTTYVLQHAGRTPARPELGRAFTWLKAHQDRQSGAWPAASMNKRYPIGSMEERFLQDAATAFAALTLIDAGQ
jgi:squalene-hopene/tetraprenyl-beta-curcumene cyclase